VKSVFPHIDIILVRVV